MSAILITLLVIGGIILLLIFLFINTYNRLVTLRNRFQNGFSQIEVQLKRRYDLIPNLIETAKGYMAHERETLEAVISARNAAVGGLDTALGEELGAQLRGHITAREVAALRARVVALLRNPVMPTPDRRQPIPWPAF